MFEHGFPKHWSTLKKLIWLVGSGVAGGASAVEKTVSGAIVHITDALAKPAISLVCQINPQQDLHGQDSPYPAGGGVNKCNISNLNPASSGSAYGLTITKDTTNDTVTLSGTPTWASSGVKQFRCYYYADSYSLYKAQFYVVSKSSNITNVDLNGINNSDNSIGISITVSDTNDINLVVRPLLYDKNASAPTAYASYSNICPISGWTGLSLEYTGKNLFYRVDSALPATSSGITVSALGTDGVNVNGLAEATIGFNVFRADVVNGVSYAVSCVLNTADVSVNIQCFLGNTYVKNIRSLNQGSPSATFTCDGTYDHIIGRITVNNGVNVTNKVVKVQLELGSTASAYQQYQGETIPVSWQTEAGTAYGGNINLTTGVMMVEQVKLSTADLINGSYEKAADGLFVLSASNATLPTNSSTNFVDPKLISNLLPTKSQTELNSSAKPAGIAHFWSNRIGIGTGDQAITTGALLKTWIENNALEIVYPLATPVTYQLDPVTVNLLLGENNIWHDANGNTELTYYADGNASTQEALGILLGGAYHNNGTAEDVPDAEALNIILGNV